MAKSKQKCDVCSKVSSLLKRRMYKELLCKKHMYQKIKKEIIDNIDDSDYSFKYLFDWTRGEQDSINYIYDMVHYEDLDMLPLLEKLIVKLKTDVSGEIWHRFKDRQFIYSGNSCQLCGIRFCTFTYRIKTLAKTLCGKCLQELEEELEIIIPSATQDRREKFIRDVQFWVQQKSFISVGSLIEEQYNYSDDSAQRAKELLAKIVVDGGIVDSLVKKMEKSIYYMREIQPLIDDLRK